ncbi:MAG: SDR family oxidoreductase [Taibaiella sp.]|nr:SDR family oxidoreductase [Taibaiella sp.]
MQRFKDKVAIVTGASSGIGLALAQQLLREGAKVAVCARNSEKLAAVFRETPGDSLIAHAMDVSDETSCIRFIESVTHQWQRIDILINNAGMSMRALFKDVDLNVLKKLMDINFWGTVLMTKYALPHILESKGSIVGVSSIAGYRGLPARTGYSSSKFAMNGFLETLRTELLHDGVHIMIASPGFTSTNIRNTSMTTDGTAQKETPLDESKLMSSEECAAIILDGIAGRKRTIIMTQQGKWTVRLNKLFPKWMDKMVYNHFRKEPNSPLK